MSKNDVVTGLPAMMGSPEGFVAQGKTYKVKPLKIKDNDEFNGLNYGNQFFTLNDMEMKAKLEKFMPRYLFSESGEPMTLEAVGEEDWSIVDLKNFLKKVIEVSG